VAPEIYDCNNDPYVGEHRADYSDYHNIDIVDGYYNWDLDNYFNWKLNWHDDCHLNWHNNPQHYESTLANPLHLSTMVNYPVRINRETFVDCVSGF
jgi:hypothetical protein